MRGACASAAFIEAFSQRPLADLLDLPQRWPSLGTDPCEGDKSARFIWWRPFFGSCVSRSSIKDGERSKDPGSPEAACRSSLQTTLRCCGRQRRGQGKGKQNLSGSCCEDERKQTTDEASKQKCLHQNQCIRTALGSVWRLPVYRPYGVRCKGGMSTTRGFYRELEKQPDGVGAVYEEIRLWRTDP